MIFNQQQEKEFYEIFIQTFFQSTNFQKEEILNPFFALQAEHKNISHIRNSSDVS